MFDKLLVGVFLGAWLSSCSSASSGKKPDAFTTPAADAAVELEQPTACAELVLPRKQYAARFALSMTLEPGVEREMCAVHQTGPTDIHLHSSDLAVSAGSHHGLLWRTSYRELPEKDLRGDPVVLDMLVPCEGSAAGRFAVTGVLAGSEGRSNVTAPGVMPDNVALTIPANSFVVSNLHMLNTSEETREACLKVGLTGIAAEQVEQEAGVLFYYDPFIAIKRGEASSARMACPIKKPVFLKSAVSHMHEHGVHYSAVRLSGDPFDVNTHVIDTLYETDEWNGPTDRIFEEPLAIEAGQWIDYRCQYQNASDRDVAQGLETTDEMCIFNGLYWPEDQHTSFCQTDQDPDVSSAGYQIGSGTLDGASFLSCVLTTGNQSGAGQTLCGFQECRHYDARFAFQRCFIDSCEAVGKYSRPYVNCVSKYSSQCSTQCDGQPVSCTLACLNDDHCKSEAAALSAARCR